MVLTHATRTEHPLTNAPIRTTLACSDVEAERRFFTEKIGLKELDTSEEGGVGFEAGDGSLLYIYPREDFHPPENTVCSFRVDDVDATVATMREEGVVFEEYDFPGLKTENGVASIGDLRSAWFKDPAGNILAVGNL